jgi:hypothetical protein
MRMRFGSMVLAIALSGLGHAQTQNWTGVPHPGNDPQLQQLYAQALAQANQTYSSAQQYMPNTPGVGTQYTAWAKQSEVLFDAKWDYWQLLNPRGSMTNNQQYMKDLAAYQNNCFPQCPSFGSGGNSNGGKPLNPTAPMNTINPSLYGAAALSRGLVSPSAEAQQEADAEATALFAEVQSGTPGVPTQGDFPSDGSLKYDGPRELDFNHPETLPDSMPGVSIITFPSPDAQGIQASGPCLTVLTCTPIDSDFAPPANQQVSFVSESTSKADQAALGTSETAPGNMNDPADSNLTGSSSLGLLNKIGNALIPAAEADTSIQGSSSGGQPVPQPGRAISQSPGASSIDPSATASLTNQVAGLVNLPPAEAQQYANTIRQVANDIMSDTANGLPSSAAFSAIDENRVTALYRTSFGGASVSVANLLDPQPSRTDPLSAGIDFLRDQFAGAVVTKAYDLTTADAVNAAIAANPSQRDEIAFRAYIVPNLLAPAQIVKGFKSFWGIVVDGRQAGEQ